MNRIKELRVQRGWLQNDLAQRLNAGKNTVSRYETEQRQLDPETIGKLCDIFDVSADYLLGLPDRSGPHLAEDEKALLDGFRALSAEGKEYVLHSLSLASLAHSGKNGAIPDVEATT